MKLQNFTIIFVIIVLPVVLLVSYYISTGLKTIAYQSLYDTGLVTATHDAIYAFELNTTNDLYSDNAETKRNIIKSSVKAFERSLCNTCNISSYSTEVIEEYVPAMVFGMYDGFYMYAPSYTSQDGVYKHNLKNYVYYSEKLTDDMIIRYSLDNYVAVSGKFGKDGAYEVREGYLIDLTGSKPDGTKYKNISIDTTDTEAIAYYKEAYQFTDWFLNTEKIGNKADYLKIGPSNDPENENSAFTIHRKQLIRNKMESVLNSSITAYSNRIGGLNYKMPSLSEEDWQKIYSNISMITFFQGKSIGLTNYNGYCVLNSTNHNEYVNPNLIYFIYNNEYHDIRCEKIKEIKTLIKGYKIGSFRRQKVETEQLDPNRIEQYEYSYQYEHNEEACYDCINGSVKNTSAIYTYVIENSNEALKTSYFTSLARERYKTVKLTKVNQKEDNKEENEGPKITNANIGDYINYNVPYTDIYTGQEYKAVNGWRYLGDDSNGNHLMVSTGIPGTFYYYPDVRSEENETDTSPRKIKNRLRNNFENINFVTNFEMNAIVFKKIGGYTEGITGTIFRIGSSSAIGVHNILQEEINHALASSSKAQALIYLNNKYWIIGDNDSSDLLYIDDENRFSYRSIDNFGIRPVVVLSAFTKLVQNQNGVWEIK